MIPNKYRYKMIQSPCAQPDRNPSEFIRLHSRIWNWVLEIDVHVSVVVLKLKDDTKLGLELELLCAAMCGEKVGLKS